jgi:hypothetical protein
VRARARACVCVCVWCVCVRFVLVCVCVCEREHVFMPEVRTNVTVWRNICGAPPVLMFTQHTRYDPSLCTCALCTCAPCTHSRRKMQ